MFLVCIVYTVLTHDFSPPKVTKSPAAFPFFKKGSIVSDWYRGEVSSAVGSAGMSDIGFVMFYAPWDAESQEVRQEFETAAEFLQGHIEFSAVNCWQPGSECRRKYNKVFKWPVLLAYTSDGRAIQYNGPKNAVHMIKFLTNVINPYRRVNLTDEIMDMMVEHDAVILATVDCRPNSKSFAAAYNVALKLLEKDPLRELGFAISTAPPNEIPTLKLYLWNETLIYPADNVFRTRSMTHWLSNHMHQVTMWLAPSGSKSQHLSSFMQGPTMILFTPQNPLMNQMDYYIALKQAALEYFSCNDTIPSPPAAKIHSHRLNLRKTYSETQSRCNFNQKLHLHQPTISYTPNLFFNSTNVVDCKSKQSQSSQCEANLPNQCLKYCHVNSQSHTQSKPACQQELNQYVTSLHSVERDRYTTKNLLRLQEELQCSLAHFRKLYHPAFFTSPNADSTSIEGLACASNGSLTMLAMDSLMYHHFAESLGVDVLKAKRKTALVIVNPKDEMHAIMEGDFNDKNLREFVLNFTTNNLPRAQVDSAQTFKHTHRYTHSVCRPGDVCIPDLTSVNFMPTIMNPSKVVIVLYHSLQCAFCSGVSYIFLETARILANVSSIQFVRIDGDRNTLPWEYTMEKYPSILLFPALHKSESRAYPESMPVTLSNLISFILANLDASIKLQAMWEICYYSNHEIDRSHCVSIVRRENLAHIESTLREWRMAPPRHRQRVLRKLQLLKTIHMNLAVETSALSRLQQVRGKLDMLSRTSLRGVLIKFIGGQFRSWRDDL